MARTFSISLWGRVVTLHITTPPVRPGQVERARRGPPAEKREDAMSLASLPKPAIDLIFRFLSHPCADMVREAFALAATDVFACDACDSPFGRYDRGLCLERYCYLCADCLPQVLDAHNASPISRAQNIQDMECVYPGGLRHVAGQQAGRFPDFTRIVKTGMPRLEHRARAAEAVAAEAAAAPAALHEALQDGAPAARGPLPHVPAEPLLQELLVVHRRRRGSAPGQLARCTPRQRPRRHHRRQACRRSAGRGGRRGRWPAGSAHRRA